MNQLLEWFEEPILESHDRQLFDCGNTALNEYLKKYARKSHERGGAKTFLAISKDEQAKSRR